MFNGLNMNLGNLTKLSDARTRSLSAENPTGEKGGGAKQPGQPDLGIGWKARPSIDIEPYTTYTLGEIDGPGAIQSMWFTGRYVGTDLIIRIYWENNEVPSVECPLGAFFGFAFNSFVINGDTGRFPTLNSLPVLVAPNRGLNCFWEMPFRKHCRITLENQGNESRNIYYQINYTLTDVPDDAAYFHAQYRQQTPVEYKKEYTILDGVKGKGHYIGTALFVGLNGSGRWWGEGEIKFYMDGDKEFPTICGTGTEDYFGGAFNWDADGYTTYSGPYMGMYYVIAPDKYRSQERFSCYRWHIMDPIRFESDLKVTIQDLGWRGQEWRLLPRRDDFYSVAYWYQEKPAKEFPKLPSGDEMEIIIE